MMAACGVAGAGGAFEGGRVVGGLKREEVVKCCMIPVHRTERSGSADLVKKKEENNGGLISEVLLEEKRPTTRTGAMIQSVPRYSQHRYSSTVVGLPREAFFCGYWQS